LGFRRAFGDPPPVFSGLLQENTTHLQCLVGFFYIFYFKFGPKKITNRSVFYYKYLNMEHLVIYYKSIDFA
jgi:hypothetical protein